jgi:hypothetical protein
MKFSHIKVGDEVGLCNDNPSSLRYYKYERARVLEVKDDQFRLNRGWFPKEEGRRGFNTVIHIDELEENNSNFYRERRADRLKNDIKQKLNNIGTSLNEIELLEHIVLLLNNSISNINIEH